MPQLVEFVDLLGDLSMSLDVFLIADATRRTLATGAWEMNQLRLMRNKRSLNVIYLS